MGRVDVTKMLGSRADPSSRVRVSNVPYTQQESKSPTRKAPLQRIVFPPYVYKLPGGRSQDFNRNNFAVTLGAGAGTEIQATAFNLPGTMKGYVQIMGIFVQSPTNNTDITFALQINGSPVSGWDNIQPPPGVANLIIQNFSDLQVELPTSAVVSIVVRNNNAFGPWTVGGKVAGWYHSESDEQFFYGDV